MRAYSKSHRVRPPVDKSMIIFAARNLSEADAFALELSLIAQHGRIDKRTGCLRNLTDGGEGASGTVVSESTKEKLILAHKGVPWTAARAAHKQSPETIAKRAKSLTGRPVSEETRAKLAAQAGWKHSEEARRKMSLARQGCVPWNKGVRKGFCHLGHPLRSIKGRQDCPTCRATRKREKRDRYKVTD